ATGGWSSMKAPRPLRSRASSTRLTGFPIQPPSGADFPGKVRSFSPPPPNVSSRASARKPPFEDLSATLLRVVRQYRNAVVRGLRRHGHLEIDARARVHVSVHIPDVARGRAAGGVERLDAKPDVAHGQTELVGDVSADDRPATTLISPPLDLEVTL